MAGGVDVLDQFAFALPFSAMGKEFFGERCILCRRAGFAEPSEVLVDGLLGAKWERVSHRVNGREK